MEAYRASLPNTKTKRRVVYFGVGFASYNDGIELKATTLARIQIGMRQYIQLYSMTSRI